MQNIYYWIIVALFALNTQDIYSQTTDVPAAAFDVIVMNNGDIIHGKVMEVGMILIRYKRTDIPDGPIYELNKSEVFAISYRNQLTEYLTPQESVGFGNQEFDTTTDSIDLPDTDTLYHTPRDNWYPSGQTGEVRIGFGLIRNYSRVKEVDDYQNEFSFPSVHISYMLPVKQNIDVGIAMSVGGFKYSDKSFSEYDLLQTDRTIKESLVSIAVVGKYEFDMDAIRPYLLAGLAFTNSSVGTEGTVTFTDDDRSVLVQGGARSSHFGVPVRAGIDVRINDAFDAFLEVGTGLSLLQLGGIIKIGQ